MTCTREKEPEMIRTEERSEGDVGLEAKGLTSIFANSPIGIFIVQDGQFRFVNPEFEKIAGYGEGELLGTDPLDLVFPDEKEMVRERAIQMLKGELLSPYEHRVVTRTGDLRWIIETVTSVRYEGRRAALGYFMDQTERQLNKEALVRSEEKFHKAFRSSPDWFVISTLDEGLYVDVNKAFLEATGYRFEEVIGKSSIDLGIWVEPDDRSRIVQEIRQKGAVRNVEIRFRMKSGEIRQVLWSAEAIDYGDEKCLLALTRDITDHKEAEQERLQKEKVQGVLETAGAACHELNQPLQFMFFLLQEVLEQDPDRPALQELKRQFDKLREITRKLENITTYQTKTYVGGSQIVDIDRSADDL